MKIVFTVSNVGQGFKQRVVVLNDIGVLSPRSEALPTRAHAVSTNTNVTPMLKIQKDETQRYGVAGS